MRTWALGRLFDVSWHIQSAVLFPKASSLLRDPPALIMSRI